MRADLSVFIAFGLFCKWSWFRAVYWSLVFSAVHLELSHRQWHKTNKWVNRLGETTIIIIRICNSLPPSIYQWSLINNNPCKLISEILLTTIRSVLEWMVLLSGTTRVVPAVARPLAAGTASAVPDSSTNHDSAGRMSGQCLFYHDHNFIKS